MFATSDIVFLGKSELSDHIENTTAEKYISVVKVSKFWHKKRCSD